MRKQMMNFRRFALLSAVLTLMALPSFAGGPLALCSEGVPFRWAGGGANIPWNPDQGTLGPHSNAAAVAAVQDSFDVWAAVPSSSVTYVNAGPLPVDVTSANFLPYYDAPAPDGRSAIVFDANGSIFNILFGAGSGILGFAGPEWGNVPTCTITEGLSFLNGPEFTNVTAAKDVMVHEFGHYNNMAHTVINGQAYLAANDPSGPSGLPNPFPEPLITTDVIETMYPFYFGPGSGTQTLHRDDIATVSAIYPSPGCTTCGAGISGTVLAPNGTTRLTGVNVIARNEANWHLDAVSAISSDYTDNFAQSNPGVGTYRIFGLTPGATYKVYVDGILQGGFSTPPSVLPGPEEYYSGASESNNQNTPDPPANAVSVAVGTTGANIIFNAPRAGDPLPVGDDGNVQIFLPFPYQLCGMQFASVFINANGNLTFGAPNGDFSETAAEMLSGPPRIAPWWDDLNVTGAARVFYAETNNSFTVSWQNVPEFVAVGSNSFSVTLKRSSNHIDFAYGAMSSRDGLAGVSCGGAITSGLETGTDLSAFTDRINLHNQPAVFQVFVSSASPNDLVGSAVLFNGTTTYDDQWAGPNNSPAHARSIDLPFLSTATNRFTEIEPSGADVDFFQISVNGGTTLMVDIPTSILDTIMAVFDAGGNMVAFDDDSGPGLLSRISLPIPTGGTYYVAVSTYGDQLGGPPFDGAGGSGAGRYILRASTLDGLFNVLTLGDDTSVSVPLPFSFPFQGSSFSSVFVNSNGNLTFGAGNTDLSESVLDLRNGPRRIAGVWDDLNPSAGGLVLVGSAGPGTVLIRFREVPEFVQTTTNSFDFVLHSTGRVQVNYGAVAALDGLAGVSQGGGVADPGESNLSSSPNWPVAGTTYEIFIGAADVFDLDNLSLSYNP